MNKQWTSQQRESVRLIMVNISFLIIQAVLLPFLPATATFEWINQSVTYSPLLASMMIPIVTFIGSMLLWFIIRNDTRSYQYQKNHKIYVAYVMFIIIGFNAFGIIHELTYLDFTLPLQQVLIAIGGLFTMLIGNILPKLKPNYVLGIRNPFTLEDDVVWIKTHHKSGYVYLFGGIFALISLVLPDPWQTILVVLVLVGVIVIPFVYSYFVYRHLMKKRNSETHVED